MNPYPSRFEKAINLVIVIIVLGIGTAVLLGLFQINPTIRIPFGLVIVLYGVVRLGMVRKKYDRRNENQVCR